MRTLTSKQMLFFMFLRLFKAPKISCLSLKIKKIAKTLLKVQNNIDKTYSK